MDKLKEQVKEQIDLIVEDGIQPSNIDSLYKLVDIHKDLENEKYWKEKIEMRRRYGSYPEYERMGYGTQHYSTDSYGRRMRDSRGRYMGRGHEMIDDMREMYQNYSDGREQYSRGNYGAKDETIESFEYMLKSFKDFFKHLEKEASSQEEVEMLRETAREIGEM